jgi:hypothetical protein
MVSRFVIAVVAVLLSFAATGATTSLPGVGRVFGYVPDSAEAIRIAITVWEPLYGKQDIASERPYKATLSSGVWHVRGSLPRLVAGGVAEADIRQSDGKVLCIGHGK